MITRDNIQHVTYKRKHSFVKTNNQQNVHAKQTTFLIQLTEPFLEYSLFFWSW